MIFFLRKCILKKSIALNCLCMNVNLPGIEFEVFAILASVHPDSLTSSPTARTLHGLGGSAPPTSPRSHLCNYRAPFSRSPFPIPFPRASVPHPSRSQFSYYLFCHLLQEPCSQNSFFSAPIHFDRSLPYIGLYTVCLE